MDRGEGGYRRRCYRDNWNNRHGFGLALSPTLARGGLPRFFGLASDFTLRLGSGGVARRRARTALSASLLFSPG